jgi:hypothetical protein
MFKGVITVQLWNESQTEQISAYKSVEIPFQPTVGMSIFVGFTAIELCSLQWDLDSGNFQATACIVEGWIQESFIDVGFHVDEFEKLSWQTTQRYTQDWPWGDK